MSAADSSPLPPLPPRDPRGHKGTFGTVVIVGGCAGSSADGASGRLMIGAPALAATAALRCGCGLAKMVVPAPIAAAAITLCPSATGVPVAVDPTGEMIASEAAAVMDEQFAAAQAIVVGPGMGGGQSVRAVALRCVQQEECPVVVDADAINALAEVPELWRDFKAAAVLTPHPGEYRRLADRLNIRADPTETKDRPRAAELLAQRLGCIVALKGAGTVVSDGQRTWINTSGGSVLATAGTGDVLAGLVAGLSAQFVSLGSRRAPTKPLDLYDATRIAVHAHGLAAELWAQRHRAGAGMLAMELADLLPEVLWAQDR
ncbi:MAG: NAD(P)H-hydrate dehydratase [Phycisphaeraceae bacterium]|nr:NAD(P)H-hydrate dehydratase [Phycisphaeraceae bacterium]